MPVSSLTRGPLTALPSSHGASMASASRAGGQASSPAALRSGPVLDPQAATMAARAACSAASPALSMPDEAASRLGKPDASSQLLLVGPSRASAASRPATAPQSTTGHASEPKTGCREPSPEWACASAHETALGPEKGVGGGMFQPSASPEHRISHSSRGTPRQRLAAAAMASSRARRAGPTTSPTPRMGLNRVRPWSSAAAGQSKGQEASAAASTSLASGRPGRQPAVTKAKTATPWNHGSWRASPSMKQASANSGSHRSSREMPTTLSSSMFRTVLAMKRRAMRCRGASDATAALDSTAPRAHTGLRNGVPFSSGGQAVHHACRPASLRLLALAKVSRAKRSGRAPPSAAAAAAAAAATMLLGARGPEAPGRLSGPITALTDE
mmetsp:Transcript_11216/g.43264  ORF Transcript_11216/g.43264 Transcript_11216/m.43264 type:complete len:385 (+) Transcript_11216:3329-4483(+)